MVSPGGWNTPGTETVMEEALGRMKLATPSLPVMSVKFSFSALLLTLKCIPATGSCPSERVPQGVRGGDDALEAPGRNRLEEDGASIHAARRPEGIWQLVRMV
jgi:hypothetical protein